MQDAVEWGCPGAVDVLVRHSCTAAQDLCACAQGIPSHLRTTAYSLDTCVAGVLGFASSPLVGVLAQRAGYRHAFDPHAQAPAAAAAESVRNARALEDSLLLLILVACGAKFVVRARRAWR